MARVIVRKKRVAVVALLLVVLLMVSCGGNGSEAGDTVRLVCDDPDRRVMLYDQIDPLGKRVGEIPCGTVVTIRNKKRIHVGDNYYLVPQNGDLPSGWLIDLFVNDFLIKFEKVN